MPTNHNETLHERYARENRADMDIYARMTTEQISDMATELHNALAARDTALAELASLKGEQVALADENARLREVDAVLDQRNRECVRLITELDAAKSVLSQIMKMQLRGYIVLGDEVTIKARATLQPNPGTMEGE